MRSIRLTVWSRAYRRLGEVMGPSSVAFSPRWNAASDLSFVIPVDHKRADDLREDGARVVAEYMIDHEPVVRRSGVVERVTGEGSELTVQWADDWAEVMQRITGWPNPSGTITQQGDDGAYWTRRGPAETVALDAIRANVARIGAGVTVPASQGRGAQIDVSLRFHPLADRLLPQVDDAGIGVGVVQVGSTRRVEVAQRQQRTTSVMTEASGAVLTGSWSLTAPTLTRVVVGCGGEGEARRFVTRIDTVRESRWPRREMFVDARDIPTDDPDMTTRALARADEKLAEAAPRSSVAAPLAETARYRYGRSYNLGDVVAVQMKDSPILTDVVREVAISWTPDAGLVVTPRVGLWDDSPEVRQAQLVARIAREQRDRRTI